LPGNLVEEPHRINATKTTALAVRTIRGEFANIGRLLGLTIFLAAGVQKQAQQWDQRMAAWTNFPSSGAVRHSRPIPNQPVEPDELYMRFYIHYMQMSMGF
jgi:hypothetical protein